VSAGSVASLRSRSVPDAADVTSDADGSGAADVAAAEDRSVAAEPRRPGRPRDAHADEVIRTAVVELLAEEGFTGLTIDAVAQRAGVGKATIYRRWPGNEQHVLDALSATKDTVVIPETGSTRNALIAVNGHLALPASQQAAVRLLPALAAEAAVNEDLAARLRTFVADRRVPNRTVLERAQACGEIDPAVDLDDVIDLITGPLLYRLFFRDARVTDEVLADHIDLVLHAVAPR
jgi:AcrR family transcriptional regulator